MYGITFNFNPEDDSCYILLNNRHVYRVKHISNHITLDIDADGMIVGINYLTIGAHIPFEMLRKDFGLTPQEESAIQHYFQM